MTSTTSPRRVYGSIRRQDQPQPGLAVVLRPAGGGAALQEALTDAQGNFEFQYLPLGPGLPLEVTLSGSEVQPVPVSPVAFVHEMTIRLPPPAPPVRVCVGGRLVRADRLKVLQEDADGVLRQAIVDMGLRLPLSLPQLARLLAYVLEAFPSDDLLGEGGCETPLTRWVEAAIGELGVGVDWTGMLIPPSLPTEMKEHRCGPFRIFYPGEVSDPPSETPIVLPGTANILGYTRAQGEPNVIQRICFWLTYARERFVASGAFKDPCMGGEIQVHTTGTSGGEAKKGKIRINLGLDDDEMARLLVHEYMHLIQEEYESACDCGSWHDGREGGGVLAEEFVMPAANTHVSYANRSGGVLSAPNTDMANRNYAQSLLLLYLAEQHPRGGMWMYRGWLERFAAQGYDPARLGDTLRELWPVPPAQGIRYDGAVWPAEDTLFGNFWLACALKDMSASAVDARFGFAGNAEFSLLGLGPRYTRMLPVKIESQQTIRAFHAATPVDLTVMPYGACFFRFEVVSSVDEVRVDFEASGALTRPLVQVAVMEPGHRIRTIVRTTSMRWGTSFPSAQNGFRIHHLWVVIAGMETSGNFRLTVMGV
jgi:hypothetical protein